MKRIVGWFAIGLGIVSLVPSLVPGAVSLVGFVISLFALVLSLISVKPDQTGYFKVALAIFLIGLLVVNDSLRIYGSLPSVPLLFKLSAYGLSSLLITVCLIGSRRLSIDESKKI